MRVKFSEGDQWNRRIAVNLNIARDLALLHKLSATASMHNSDVGRKVFYSGKRGRLVFYFKVSSSFVSQVVYLIRFFQLLNCK